MAYHHGDLRRALLGTAAEVIAESGPAALSLRDVARRAGVSHAAPTYHFGDKAGLLTAFAAEGFTLLAEELAAAGADLVDVGLAYVRFATGHHAHFEVMFRPDLYRVDDPQVGAARTRSGEILAERVEATVGDGVDVGDAQLAAWSIVHGFATLWLSRALPPDNGDDPVAVARPVLRLLFRADARRTP